MALFEKNMSPNEGLRWSASGFVAMVIGLMLMIMRPIGVVVAFVGLCAVAVGLLRWNPAKTLIVRK